MNIYPLKANKSDLLLLYLSVSLPSNNVIKQFFKKRQQLVKKGNEEGNQFVANIKSDQGPYTMFFLFQLLLHRLLFSLTERISRDRKSQGNGTVKCYYHL